MAYQSFACVAPFDTSSPRRDATEIQRLARNAIDAHHHEGRAVLPHFLQDRLLRRGVVVDGGGHLNVVARGE